MKHRKKANDEKGLAIVLVLSLIALLSMLGVWLTLESESAFRVTTSAKRHETTFNAAEAALQLSLKYLRDGVPSSVEKNVNLLPDDYAAGMLSNGFQQQLLERKEVLEPELNFIDSNPLPPPGWDTEKFQSFYYKAIGEGRIPLPASRGGEAKSVVSQIVLRVAPQ